MARDVAKIAAALAALLMLGACGSKADKARSEFIGSCASSGGNESALRMRFRQAAGALRGRRNCCNSVPGLCAGLHRSIGQCRTTVQEAIRK